MADIKDKLKDIVPPLMLILALLTFLFGGDIISKLFSNADIVMETELVNEFMPKEWANKEIYKDNPENSVDSLRIIRIKNEGKSTKNFRIILNLDGPIYFKDIKSPEVIKEKRITSESTIILSLDRLSHNSTIDIKVWLDNEKKSFDGSYTDDVSTSKIHVKSQNENIYKTIFYTILVVIFFISIILMVINYRRRLKSKREAEEDRLIERVLSQVSEDTHEESNDEECQETPNETNSYERLRDLIRQNQER